MDKEPDYIDLLTKAQNGDKKALNQLARTAAERLRVYVYRLTLAEDLTQDIVQETMLEMCRILGKLKSREKFWPWLYGIATNKIHRHHRKERSLRRLAQSRAEQDRQRQREQGLQNLVSDELRQIVSSAMQSLTTRHRAVLVMRCYDQLSFGEIAESMGCSEFGTRMLFLRAKRALQKQLVRNGFGRGSLLAALVLFGKMTAPTEAAAAQVSVTAATTSVGFLAGLLGLAMSKSAIISITAAGLVAAGSVAVNSSFSDQARGRRSGRAETASSPLGHSEGTGEQRWYYFPDGPGGAVMTRVRAAGAEGGPVEFLQNDRANYKLEGQTLYINNHRMYAADLSVLRLPTDSPQLAGFISEVEGGRGKKQMQYVTDTGRGLLIVSSSSDGPQAGGPRVTHHPNILDEDYFQGDWPAGTRTVDNRERMHARGWTYFSVSGRVNGQPVFGAGRIPFVYAAVKDSGPWLRLGLADGTTIIDTTGGARVVSRDSKVVAEYAAGTFFRGLPRPWMGLHTIDIIRRDAAEQRMPFKTELLEGDKARVTISGGEITLGYTVALGLDVVELISISRAGVPIGQLVFSYLQDVDDAGGAFVSPGTTGYRPRGKSAHGIGWLLQLAQGTLTE